MSRFAVTVDLDWAGEAAVEETLDYLEERGIPATVFVTHRSARVEEGMGKLDVGLHPYFGVGSSHGQNINEIVSRVLDFPHNIPAFRVHRFATSNLTQEAMLAAGMRISSNVCTDMEIIPPFFDRQGLLEIPIFLEDGGHLLRQHPLHTPPIDKPGTKVLLLHPMHFVINTPSFSYMADIKRVTSRTEWSNMTRATINTLRWRGRGIRDIITDILARQTEFTTIRAMASERLSEQLDYIR